MCGANKNRMIIYVNAQWGVPHNLKQRGPVFSETKGREMFGPLQEASAGKQASCLKNALWPTPW